MMSKLWAVAHVSNGQSCNKELLYNIKYHISNCWLNAVSTSF